MQKYLKKRLFSMSLLFMGMFLLLLGRFFFLQVIQGEGYLKEYEEEISRETSYVPVSVHG